MHLYKAQRIWSVGSSGKLTSMIRSPLYQCLISVTFFLGNLDLTSGFLLFALTGPNRRSLYIPQDQLVFLVLFTPPTRMCCGVPGDHVRVVPVLVWPDLKASQTTGKWTCAVKSLEDRQYRCIVSIPSSMFSDGVMLKSCLDGMGFFSISLSVRPSSTILSLLIPLSDRNWCYCRFLPTGRAAFDPQPAGTSSIERDRY